MSHVSKSDLENLPTLPPSDGFRTRSTSWMALEEDRFGWMDASTSKHHGTKGPAWFYETKDWIFERRHVKEGRDGSLSCVSNPEDVYVSKGWRWKGRDGDVRPHDWKIVLDKRLTKYDVQKKGSDPNAWKGRIIVPRSSVEDLSKEEPGTSGREILLSDLQGNNNVPYKFVLKGWNNRRKKMYVLEGAGNYLSAHDLQLDDRILVLVDPFGCLHLQHEKKGFHPSRENEETHANLMK